MLHKLSHHAIYRRRTVASERRGKFHKKYTQSHRDLLNVTAKKVTNDKTLSLLLIQNKHENSRVFYLSFLEVLYWRGTGFTDVDETDDFVEHFHEKPVHVIKTNAGHIWIN